MVLRLALVALVVLLAGCGGDDDESTPATTQEPAVASTDCVAVTSDLMAPLGGRVTLEGGRLRNGQMVQSEAVPDYWFVAAELDGPGYEDEGDVATFATTSQFGGEAIYAVGELAEQHTTLRPIDEIEGIDAGDPAADDAAACVAG
jgi:hypothetical protein